ncbi:uncharacterized protein EDB93DRAFT_1109118 [Suillus bovinus]|uniref:uncharacterized protein n=1 Tax=Suillus bovinus TaxID=48563 RepID=UPI001B87E9E2|nr:uncharacterized protein EDB93DRAFT_1109118 [Suillus bovinus]KAG2127933.1 hypothetical protein EDB93DRAFT_1109118 [Suillus bovinus]
MSILLSCRGRKVAFDNNRYNEAVDHFTAAVNASAFFHKSPIHSTYDEFVMLFGWDLKSLWQNANQKQCRALLRAGRIAAAIESYQSTMDKSGEDMKARLGAWFTGSFHTVKRLLPLTSRVIAATYHHAWMLHYEAR